MSLLDTASILFLSISSLVQEDLVTCLLVKYVMNLPLVIYSIPLFSSVKSFSLHYCFLEAKGPFSEMFYFLLYINVFIWHQFPYIPLPFVVSQSCFVDRIVLLPFSICLDVEDHPQGPVVSLGIGLFLVQLLIPLFFIPKFLKVQGPFSEMFIFCCTFNDLSNYHQFPCTPLPSVVSSNLILVPILSY